MPADPKHDGGPAMWVHEAVESSPQLKRGRVWCHRCGRMQSVDSAACIANGWPKCCGYTMSLDSPAERTARRG
jgi:hypothetical protein